MGRGKSNKKKHAQSILVSDEVYTILKGYNRNNIEALEQEFDMLVEGKSSLTLRHNNAQTLSHIHGFFRETLLPEAKRLNSEAKESWTQTKPYRPSNTEMDSFKAFFTEALATFKAEQDERLEQAKDIRLVQNFDKKAGNTPATAKSTASDMAQSIILKPLEFRGPNEGVKQRAQHSAIQSPETDLVFSLGLTGSGKTYTSLASSFEMLQRGDIEKIYVIRPYVSSGRHRMGDVPGNESKKLRSLMKGVIDNVNHMLDPDCGLTFDRLAQKGLIDLQPLDKIRSTTFHNCAVLITEAQNVDYDQRDILLRIGENCTFIIDGSFEQKDAVVAYPALIDWTIRYADDVQTPFIHYADDADIVRSPQSLRHIQALKKPMPEGYVDYKKLTPEFTRNTALQNALENNRVIAQEALSRAAQRTLRNMPSTPHRKQAERTPKRIQSNHI